MITAIVAHGQNLEIGRDNQLLCYLPGDLKRFRELTTGHTILMGRKTWDSLPKKPLPNRTNIVITGANTDRIRSEGAQIVLNLEETKYWVKANGLIQEIYIIGGEQIYRHFLPDCGKLLVSRIPRSFSDADAFFPSYTDQFTRAESISCKEYDFETWVKNPHV